MSNLKKPSSNPHKSWIRSFFWRYKFGFFVGGFFALLLGMVTGLLGLLIGPALQVLTHPGQNSLIPLSDLLAGRTLLIAESLYPSGMITRELLLQGLPYALLVVAGVRMVTGIIQWYLIECSAEKAVRDLRMAIIRNYLSSSPYSVKKERNPLLQLSSFISYEIQVLKELYTKFYGGIPREIFQILFLMIALLELSPALFSWFFLLLGPAIAGLHRLGKRLKKNTKHALSDYSDLSEWLQARLLGIETIKHYRTEDQELHNMDGQNQKVLQKFLKAARVRARISPFLEFSGVIALSLTLVVALQQIESGSLSGATASSFFASLVLLSQCVLRLSRYYTSYREGAACEQRLGELHCSLQDLQGDSLDLKDDPRLGAFALVVKVPRFYYPGQEKLALETCEIAFPKGAMTCIQGPSGAGKSTLIRMILGLEPCERFLAKGPIGYLPQDVRLFEGSVADNVCWPKPFENEQLAHIQSCLKKVGFDINPLSSSQTLSGGEAQRVLLARMWFHQYPCLLIDEGTSALDPVTERIVTDGLRELVRQGVTILMVAHREQTLALADYVIELESGAIKRDSVRTELSSEWEQLQTNLQQFHMSPL